MHPLDNFADQAWAQHADHPEAVAERLTEGIALTQDDDGVQRLAMLAQHVLGEHLGRWQAGLDFLATLAERGVHGEGGAASLARCRASLQLCGQTGDPRPDLGASERCRVTAMAAANLHAFDVRRATDLLTEAGLLAAGLTDGDPGVRGLAASSHNIAAGLQEAVALDPLQRHLMLQAAQASRTQWARAGGWRELERAEYRLAMCWLAAGDARQAQEHAQRCDVTVRAHGSEPLELFFAAEALALSAHALGDAAGQGGALATARSSFEHLAAEDQAWCRATLDKLTQGAEPHPAMSS